ncbi:MAG: helix-turn-helix domain-containing protein [Hyphomicrobiaceae bacterium]|nr:helix-turn-helix domain-containing protein [Hyphomicrobiaceae bacterium]
MPQGILPLFADDATPINGLISFQRKHGMVYYFHGCLPLFSHPQDDKASFRMFTSQLYIDGNCKQSEIVKAFGVTSISVKRAVKKYREGGPAAFFQSPHTRRQPRILTDEVVRTAQSLLDEGMTRSDIANELNIKSDTLYRAIRSGKLTEKKTPRHKKV